jgi:LysM repeat protein
MRSFPVAMLLALSSFVCWSATVNCQIPAGSSSASVVAESEAKRDERIDLLIARSNDHVRRAKLYLEANKHVRARDEFDRAIDEILLSGLDVRASERLHTFYLELVETIYRIEVSQMPPVPRSERIKNPVKASELYIPASVQQPARSQTSPQETSGSAASADSEVTKYRARKGDTIAKIAAAYKLSADQVAKLNGIAATAQLQPGQEIKLPIIESSPTLNKLRGEYVQATIEYKASLEKLLALYENSEKRAEQYLENTKRLVAQKMISDHSVEDAEREVADEKLKIEGVRKQIADADKQIAQGVIEARQQQIKEARDRERADELIGPKPAQSANGTMPIVLKWFNDYLHDPYSARYVSWTRVRKGLHDGEPYWIVAVRIRAKNAFNAYRLSDYIFYIRRNRVVLYDSD